MMDITNMFEHLDPTFWKKGRLQTFKHWPFQGEKHQCNPENMAAAGFHAVGGEDEPDLAECFMCHKQLDGWEPDDDPWKEHKKHQPNCLFMQINKLDEKSMTLKELFQLVENHYRHKLKLQFKDAIEEVKKEWKKAADGIPAIYEAKKKSQMNI